jgi:hypothetical protein
MTSQTLSRRSPLTGDDVPAIVLKAAARGDILRKVRDMHPQGQRLNDISAAEAAVAESGRLLDNLAREHQLNMDRLNVLRQRQDLTPVPVQPLPQIATTGTDLVGRVIRRDRLTHQNKTAGTMLLSTGDEIRWTAAASYVDALDVLFDGVPIQVTGPFLANGSLSIQSALPAPRSYWTDGEDYDAHAELGGMTVMAAGLLKKELRRTQGHDCHMCAQTISKRVHASVAYLSAGPVLVCRPCKQEWNDAGRPTA